MAEDFPYGLGFPQFAQKFPLFSCPQEQVQTASGRFFPQLEQKLPVFSCPQEQVQLPDNGAIFAGPSAACCP